MKKLHVFIIALGLLSSLPITAMFSISTEEGKKPRIQKDFSEFDLLKSKLEDFILDATLMAYNNFALIRKTTNPNTKKLGYFTVKILELPYDPNHALKASDLYFDTLEDAQIFAQDHLLKGQKRHSEYLNPTTEALPTQPTMTSPTLPPLSPKRTPRTPEIDIPLTAYRRSALSPTHYNLPDDEFLKSLSLRPVNLDTN